jgi:peptidoglycan/xylan/chitin deacetylase (PgdA/CDA1 family)
MFYFLFFQYFPPKNTFFRIKTKNKFLALTFDDGPNPSTTLEILEILKKYNLKAAFFQIGKNIEKHPQITERIFKEGHIIGNHLFNHSFFVSFSFPKLEKDLIKTQELIFQIIKKRPKFFRPPYFFVTPAILKIVKKQNLILIGSTAFSSFEPEQPPASLMVFEILEKIFPGAILTFHEGWDTKMGNYRQTTKAVSKIIPKILEKGYKILPLSDLLETPPYF